jgi:class 3 adenylate cyclase/tetratricopeptide (TPR) repeat protein
MSASPLASPRRDRSAILFADVHGYAQLMDRNEERTYERVSRSIRLMKSLIGDYGGRVMNVAGDGVLALFESAPEALRFAVTIQQELRNDAVWSPDDEPVAFRIGINLGEVLVDEEANVQGRSVNVAARIQALAPPGGICLSAAVQHAVQEIPDTTLRSLGPRHLKNIAEPVEVFVVEQGTSPPAIIELPAHPTVLPLAEASVAVLPLANLSGDPGDIHLCDGITGDIITNLSRFRDLLVIARHSTFLFKDTRVPPKVIGDQLGVRYLLTGGLQRDGSRIRTNVELSEIASGRVIWADRLKGDLGDVFAFQDDVTDVIAARLAVQISAAERRRALSAAPPDLRAYGLALRGHDLSLRRTQGENLHARRLFEQAAELDPGYGRPYAGLSRTFNVAWQYRWAESPEACLDRAVELALEAIQHDSLDARGYSQLGYAYLFKKQQDASLAAYEQAIDLNPNDADILADMAISTRSSGDTQRTMDLVQRAMRLNPFYPDVYLWVLGEAYFDLGRYEDAIHALHKRRNKSDGHRLLAASYALLGRIDEAKYHAGQVMAVHPNFSIEHWRNVPPDKNPEPLERFIEGLRLAGLR